MRSRLTPDNVMFVRYTALFRKFTDIGSAMKKLKKKRKIKPATPNFHFSWSCNNCGRSPFYTVPWMRWDAASKSHTYHTLTIYDCENTPDEGHPYLINTVTILLENSEKFCDDFREVWLVLTVIRPGRFSSSSETCGWTPAGNNL